MFHKFVRADCRSYLTKFRSLNFDLCIADPPYEDYDLINEAMVLCRKVAVVSFFFMYAEGLCRLDEEPDQVLFWLKPVSTKNTSRRYSRFVEVIAVYGVDYSPFLQDTHWSTRSGVFTDSLVLKPRHPHEKPESLLEKIVGVKSKNWWLSTANPVGEYWIHSQAVVQWSACADG